MKMNLNKWGRTLMIALLGIGLVSFNSCGKDPQPTPTPDPTPTPTPTPDPTPGGGSTSGDSWAYLINETPHEVQLNVTFTNIPSGYTEFEAVYNNLLGKSIQGTAAMVPMAIEMYARDAALGERCLNLLCNAPTTVSEMIRILKNVKPNPLESNKEKIAWTKEEYKRFIEVIPEDTIWYPFFLLYRW